MQIFSLRCQNQESPLGVGFQPLRLTFCTQPPLENLRVFIGSAPGKRETELPVAPGMREAFFTPEKPRTQYHWFVEGEGPDGVCRSEPALFETGLSEACWQGCFIGQPFSALNAPYFRHRFRLKDSPVQVRAYLATEGYSELWLNGQKLTGGMLSPANSDYARHLHYHCYDVTPFAQKGQNAVGVLLCNGWAAHGKFLFQLYARYADGTEESVYSRPAAWVYAHSPITLATLYGGETYNPLYEQPGWCLPDDSFESNLEQADASGIFSSWQPDSAEKFLGRSAFLRGKYYPACELPAPAGEKVPAALEPIRVCEEILPVSFEKKKNGLVVYDFGRNFAGVCRLRVKGPKGTRIVLRHSELLDGDGNLNFVYMKHAAPDFPHLLQTDVYFLKGEGELEEYTPRFTYHGFRYVSIENLPCEPEESTLTGLFVHSDVAERGHFETEHPMLSWLDKAIRATELSNLYSIPTDCPQRPERQGWLNDATARCEGAVYNLDLQLMFTKWLADIAGTQDPVSGAIADTAPFRRGNFPGDPVISSFLLVPYYLYWHFGDIRPLEKHFPKLCAWADYLLRNSREGLSLYSFYGDWAGPAEGCLPGNPVSYITPGHFISSGFNYYNCKLLAEMAGWLGEKEKAEYYAAWQKKIGMNMLKHFYDKKTAQFATGSQGANVFALYIGLAPKGDIARVVENVAKDIAENKYHLTTGNLCTKYLMEMLTEHGRGDLAMRLIEQDTYPSWGFMRAHGATTIWERWEYATGFGMNSHSHPMYGAVTAWYYKYLAGINPLKPGFLETLVRPFALEGIPGIKATLQTGYGEICSAWKRGENGITFTVTFPPGMKGKVEIPKALPVEGDVTPVRDCKYTFTQTGKARYFVPCLMEGSLDIDSSPLPGRPVAPWAAVQEPETAKKKRGKKE